MRHPITYASVLIIDVNETHDLVRDIFAELERQSPSIREVSYMNLSTR